MKTVWKWVLGIAVVLVVLSLLAMPFMMSRFYGVGGGYGMMSGPRSAWRMLMHGGFGGYGGYGGWMPMMGGGYGMMGSGTLLSGLIQLGVLALIVLAIIWMVRAISRQGQQGN
jgi:hypothetical protein